MSDQPNPTDRPASPLGDPGIPLGTPQFNSGTAKNPYAAPAVAPEANLPLAIVGGLVAAAIGAGAWAAIAVFSDSEFGILAVGVGFLVGLAVRLLGKGDTPVYGAIGAVCALLGLLAGKVLIIVWIASNKGVLSQLDVSAIFRILGDTFSAMDLLFYGLALYCGYKYSIRRN